MALEMGRGIVAAGSRTGDLEIFEFETGDRLARIYLDTEATFPWCRLGGWL